MADWVHCNLCFKQPGGERKFSLTNCGHIYCEECLPSESHSRCKMCGKEPVTTILLTAKMKSDVEIFFLDPAEIAKKQQKQLLQLARQESMMHKAQKAMEQCRDLEKLVAGQGIYVGPSPSRQGMVHSGHAGPSPGKQGMVHSGYIGPSQGRQLMGHGTCGGPSPGSRPKGEYGHMTHMSCDAHVMW
ncbi:hypothetical protein NP493_403g06015 [Ridgeia piscesae]|uniref:RING-type domain-containing protein n=1 Tax=Ridgeia piscesae TaxID=27915 RepID=A0AAD9NT22_RIDPI|nr:hypothetical protein NP493_403g06015 [Ridgeia piscesae]